MADTTQVTTIDQHSFVAKYPGHYRHRKQRNKKNYKLDVNQVERLVKAAKYHGRHCLRDSTLIMMAFEHSLKVSELINLKWNHIDLKEGTLLVSRLKNGQKTIHRLTKKEVENLRLLEEKYIDLEYVFISERKQPLSSSHVCKMIKRAGEDAGLPTKVQPSMLNGSCGFKMLSVRATSQAMQH
jgi:type 1 fimbriae regulatory protein FimE